MKLCTVWSAETRDAEDRPVRDEGSITYTAAIESAATLDTDEVPAAFTQRVLREAARRRFTAAARSVVLGDDAPWIWKIAQELFPRAIQIVDRFHVKQHLSDVAKAIYGADSKQAHEWAQRRQEELDSGRIPDLLRAIRRHADRSEDARKCLQYIHRNRDRMKYPAFEAQGFDWGRRGRLQSRHWNTPQARRHALDYGWRQLHYCPPLLPAQRPLSGLLGASR